MRRPTACLLCVILGALAGCGGGGGLKKGDPFTRRGIERQFLSTPEYGAARGRKFEDIIPVGARIAAVHVANGSHIQGIWLTYERNGTFREMPCRGTRNGHVEVLKLDRDEKIVGLHAEGRGVIDRLVVATNKRTRSFGTSTGRDAAEDAALFAGLTEEARQRNVGIGITGRADDELRQLSLRLQVRGEG